MTHKVSVFKQLKRLLQFAGTEITEISITQDGVVADFEIDGDIYRMFLVPKKEIKPLAS